MLTPNGRLDLESNQVFPTNTGTWDDIATWDGFTSWYNIPTYPLVYITERFDLFTQQDFNLKIETATNGQVSYEVYTSNTGSFVGEETTVAIAPGDTNVSGFNGTYYMIGVTVTQGTGLTTIDGIQATTSNRQITETITQVDTSTLAGTVSAREIPISRNFSILTAIDVISHEVTSYKLDVYVTDYLNCKTVIPRVVSKNRAAPTIALIGLDNVPRDGIVDLKISGLPEQYMSGNNLLVK